MRILGLIILLIAFKVGHAQLNSRSFSHDFGDILEKNGKVSFDFKIENFGTDTIHVVDIESSCGCTSFFLGDQKIAPKKTNNLKVSYDPSGRPGRFHKTIRIRYQYMNFAYEALFTVRGNVIRNDADLEVNKITDLKIQPFDVLPVSRYDTSFSFLPRLEEFINGITYEIDLHGFAVLGVDHISYTVSNKGRMDWLITKLKKRIERGILERGYQSYQVTYRKTEFDFNFIPDWSEARISLYSTKYTSKDVYFYQVHREIKENNKDFRHLFWSHRVHPDSFDLDLMIEDFSRLLQLKLNINDSLKMEYIFDISYPLIKKKKKFDKTLSKAMLKIEKSNPGLKIVFREVFADSENEVWFKAFQTLEEKPKQTIRFITKEAKVIPPMLPVAHYDFEMNDQKAIDTSDVTIKRILANAIIHINRNQKIEFNIESSVSHFPRWDKQTALFHARKKGRNAQEIITLFMENRGVDSKMFSFNQLPLVQGPSYSKKYAKSFYNRFEYLNIIPVFELKDTSTIQQIKYMVNFNSNAFTLDSTATMFIAFMDGIISEINQYGFSKVILESSSSKAPTRTKENYSNDVISYKRAEETRDIMKNYLHRSGIDPNRLILIEERCLVQGPEYNLDYFENKEKYKQFQYIKIIPHRLLSE